MRSGKAHLLQLGKATEAQGTVELALVVGWHMAQVEEATIRLVGHRPVDAREPILIYLGRELAGLLDLGDGAKLQRGQLGRPLADAVGEMTRFSPRSSLPRTMTWTWGWPVLW